MAPEPDPSSRAARKLTKRRKPFRASSVQYPERLKMGEDVQEDVTATRGQPAQYMNQSVFSMIAAAGSKVDFHARFDEDSSESEEEQSATRKRPQKAASPSLPVTQQGDAQPQTGSSPEPGWGNDGSMGAHGCPPSLHLDLSSVQEKDHMSESTILPSAFRTSTSNSQKSQRHPTPRDAPVMSKMLEAQAELSPSTILAERPIEDPHESQQPNVDQSPTSLALRLKEIFGFDDAEEVISEYPCWLLQSVLLQGYMYITRSHICFYAYLPKKSNVVTKSGHLSKKGRQNPKYRRFWFALKGDVLSYFTDQSDLYFPSGNIDLRYGISAALTDHKDKSRDAKEFSVVTHQRVYYFKADSVASAKEWVKTLQKVIFRSHNDGDSVKISLPTENVIDIEMSPVIDFAETFKIRIVDSDETYAIDEYFFSFFSFGKDAFEVLRTMIDGSTAQQINPDLLTASPATDNARSRDASQKPQSRASSERRNDSPIDPGTPILRDQVRATLMPASSLAGGQSASRPSGEWARNSLDLARKSVDANRKSLDLSRRDFSRSSFDKDRRSVSASRPRLGANRGRGNSPRTAPHASTSSFVQSVDQRTESSVPDMESNDTLASQASGSRILQRSEVFQSPRIMPHSAQEQKQDGEGGTFQQTDFSELRDASVHNGPPVNPQIEQRLSEDNEPSRIRKGRPSQPRSPTLNQLVKAGGYPLQKAAGFAGFLRTRSKKMSSMLATESMGYVEKVSGMWAGGHKHYTHGQASVPQEGFEDMDDEGGEAGYGDRFRAHFALPPSERLQATFFGHLHRVLPLYGKIYVSNKNFCFRSLLPGTRTRLVLPLKDIENVDKEKGFRFGYSGLVIVIRGHEEIFFEFSQHEVRDDCTITLLENLESSKYLDDPRSPDLDDRDDAELAKAEHMMLQEARRNGYNEHDLKLPRSADDAPSSEEAPPILFDDPRVSILNFKPTECLRVTCLTIGSRGDVQPYIALCKGLVAEGHKPKIATHKEFEPWVRKHGIEFAPVDGDPAELMRICVENGMFTYSFLKEASAKFRGWIDELLTSAWKACQDTDLLIESPSAMAGIHIAEALGVPYFRAFTMPWTRTRAYPHAFAVPEHKMGGAYNYITYVMFDNVFWKAIAGQVNRWRKKELGLRSTSLDKLQPNKVPFLYNFSPSVVVPPLDYSDWIRVTGYWFLDEAQDWTPPQDLTEFVARAREDEKKIVYIGFGSIVVSDPAALTKTVVDSVIKADVRAILSKGWSDRLGGQDATVPEIPLPPEILQIKSAPHDWLFKQIDAAVHHGGAGTTGASLRAGVPTIVKPFFGDQFFFGSRIEDLGVGICMRKLNVSVFSRALWEATHSQRMIIKARVLGEQIRKEDGVGTAIQTIYRDLEYAKTLIKHQRSLAKQEDGGAEEEESWTFIGDESDPELTRRIRDWEPPWEKGSLQKRKGR